ncbi:MAG TPA: TIM barrel protein [Pirellulales bacterium]|jgi:sugar phosphate isomerase/epimerase
MFRNLSSSALGISGRQSEIIELSLSFGFKGIDIDIVDFQEQVKTYGLPHARRLIDSARLKFGVFRLPLVWDEDDDAYKNGLPALDELTALAAELGLTRAVTAISPANDLRPYHENFEFHRRRLAEIGQRLGEKKIRLGLEFRTDAEIRKNRAFQFIHAFDALATLVGMIRSPHVGVVADLFELYAAGSSFDEVRKLGGDKVIALIASDAPTGKQPADCTEADRMLPGENGTIDVAAALVALAEMGFEGPITPAISAAQAKGMKREQLVKTAGERLTQAWTAAGLSASGKLSAVAKK